MVAAPNSAASGRRRESGSGLNAITTPSLTLAMTKRSRLVGVVRFLLRLSRGLRLSASNRSDGEHILQPRLAKLQRRTRHTRNVTARRWVMARRAIVGRGDRMARLLELLLFRQSNVRFVSLGGPSAVGRCAWHHERPRWAQSGHKLFTASIEDRRGFCFIGV